MERQLYFIKESITQTVEKTLKLEKLETKQKWIAFYVLKEEGYLKQKRWRLL